jgi:hypothetical protein
VLIPALILACAALSQEERPAAEPRHPSDGGLHFSFLPGLRVGGWWMGESEAVTPAGARRIKSTLFFDAGIDLRAEYGGWTLAPTADYGVARDLTIASGGVLFGKCWQLGESAHFVQLSAGPLFGKLDVSMPGFGNFKSAVGAEVRLSSTVAVHDHIELQLWADYRHLKFDFDETVLSGDKDTGGGMFAVGAGFLMRF